MWDPGHYVVSSVAGTLGKRMRATVEVDFSLSALSLSFVFLHGASTPFLTTRKNSLHIKLGQCGVKEKKEEIK